MRGATRVLLVVAGAAHGGPGLGGSLVLTTDYIFRGLSQTQNEAAVQGDVHYGGTGGWFVGVWGSNVEFEGGGPTTEFNLYAGLSRAVTPDWSARLTFVHYDYPADRTAYNYDELSATVDFQSRAYLTVAWSPNTSRYAYVGAAQHRTLISYELNLRQPLKYGLSAGVGAGYYDLADLFGTSYWAANGGLLYALGPWQFDVTYYHASEEARVLFGSKMGADHWVATALWRF